MEYDNDFQPDTHAAVQDQDGEQQFRYDFPTQPGDEVNDSHNNLFSVEHYTDAATYDESIAIAAAFADPAQPPQSLAFLQQEQKQAAKKKIVGYAYKKAPGAPKRWKSSYIYFFTDFVERKKRLVGNDGIEIKLNMHEVAKEASKAWKEIPANEKQHWDSISQKAKEEYDKKLGDFEGPLQVRTDRVKKKDLGAPKRSPPAFFLFTKVKGPQLKELNPKTPHGEIMKECGKLWRNMSDSEKASYREEEQKLRAQYHVDMQKWKDARKMEEKEAEEKLEEERKKLIPLLQSDEPESADAVAAAVATAQPDENLLNPEYETTVQPVLDYCNNLSEEPRTRKRRTHDGTQDNAPKRSPSAFFIFCNHRRPQMKLEYPELPYHEMITTLSQSWKAMTDDQQKPFRDREAELREQYYFKKTHYKKNKKNIVKLKGGVEDQQQQNENITEGVGADIPVARATQIPKGNDEEDLGALIYQESQLRKREAVGTTEQEQRPLTFAPLANDVHEVVNYQQEINYQEENHDYQHDLSFADYNIEPINVSAGKTDDVQDESGEYIQHQISHQASIDYGAVGDYFGL